MKSILVSESGLTAAGQETNRQPVPHDNLIDAG